MKQLELIEKPQRGAWDTAWDALKKLHPEHEKFKDKSHGGIQWKGTSICMDVRCACGHEEHIDAEFFYSWVCPECKTIYWVGDMVPLLPIPKEIAEGLGRDTEPVPESLCTEQDIHDAGVPNLEDAIANPEPLKRAEYDYLCKWLGKLGDSDAAQAYPVLRQMRDSYHD